MQNACCNTFDMHYAIIGLEDHFFCLRYDWSLKTGFTIISCCYIFQELASSFQREQDPWFLLVPVLHCASSLLVSDVCGSRRGTGGPDHPPPPPPRKSQIYRVSWSGFPEKPQRCQASIQCWAIIGSPAKRHLDDDPLIVAYVFGFSLPSFTH